MKLKKKITTDYDHDNYISTQEFTKLTSESFNARIKQENLASKNDITNFVKKADFDNKLKNITQIKMNLMNYQNTLKQYQLKD